MSDADERLVLRIHREDGIWWLGTSVNAYSAASNSLAELLTMLAESLDDGSITEQDLFVSERQITVHRSTIGQGELDARFSRGLVFRGDERSIVHLPYNLWHKMGSPIVMSVSMSEQE